MPKKKTAPDKRLLWAGGTAAVLAASAALWLWAPASSLKVAVPSKDLRKSTASVIVVETGPRRYRFPLRVRWWDMKAADALRRGWYDEARILTERSLAAEPRDPQALVDRGTILAADDALDKARADYSAALEIEPNLKPLLDMAMARAYLRRGKKHIDKRRTGPALRDIRAAVELDPENAQAHSELASIALLQNRFKACLEHLDRALLLEPRMQEAYGNRGACLAALGKYREALRALDKAIELDPRRPETYGTRAGVHIWLRDPEAALRDAREAVRLDPKLEKTLVPLIRHAEGMRKSGSSS